MIHLIAVSPLLHTPMYYFLSSLSFIDLCYSSVVTPKMLVNSLVKKNTILYSECMAQLFFFFFMVADGDLLTVMAYDRYVAICSPLPYHLIMSFRVCSVFVLVSFTLGFLSALAHTSAMMKLSSASPKSSAITSAMSILSSTCPAPIHTSVSFCSLSLCD